MASTSVAPAAQTQTSLPDDIWEDILLRLDAAADLARASAACSSFHSIVSERRFLRRFRSLHSPPILGFISRCPGPEILPVDPPHRSAPEARALQQAADFTFSFLPYHRKWRFRHARDDRVLLSKSISTKTQFEDFLVCDPLHRRYVKIPRIPTDLMASAADNATTRHLSPVLAPSGDNDEEESFRVICTVRLKLKHKVVGFVFSSANQMWRGIISTISLPDVPVESSPYYAHGCLYWIFYCKGYSLMLNTSEMEFSIIELPPHNVYSPSRVIVEAEEGRLGFITIANGTIDLYCKNWQRNGVGAQELEHDKLISLPKDSGMDYDWHINDITGRYLSLVAFTADYDKLSRDYKHFVLDIKTWHIEMLYTSSNDLSYAFPYARFPPPLALPSI